MCVCKICFTPLMLMESVHPMPMLMGDPLGSPLFLFMYTKLLSSTIDSWYVYLCDYKLMVMRVKVMPKDFQLCTTLGLITTNLQSYIRILNPCHLSLIINLSS